MKTRIKRALSTALVKDFMINESMVHDHTPKAGDVGVFRVMNGNQKYIRDINGANQYIFEGDLILAVFGNRYATNQVEAYVPKSAADPIELISRGGVAGVVKTMNSGFKYSGVYLQLEAYAVDAHQKIINTTKLRQLDFFSPERIKTKIVLSIGSSMDSGKTTTAAYLCKGLMNAGAKTAYMKLTGTVFNKDTQLVYDRGAALTTDFSSLGFPSTYLCSKNILLDIYQSLYLKLEEECHPDIIIVEIADGLLQRETQMLLQDPTFMSTVSDVVLSCGDSLGALAGLNYLQNLGLKPYALSGLFTASDLLVQEVKNKISTPIFKLEDLLKPEKVVGLTLDSTKRVAA